MIKRILLVTPWMKSEIVGPSKFVQLLYKNFGSEIDILTEDGIVAKNVQKMELNLSFFEQRIEMFFKSKLYSKKALELIRSNDYDSIIFTDSKLAFFFINKVNAIVLPRIWIMVNDEHYLGYKKVLGNFARNYILKRMEKSSILKSFNVIVPSNFLKQLIINNYQKDSKSIHVFPVPIDLEKYMFNKNRPKLFNGPIAILFIKWDFIIGGLSELKAALRILKEYEFDLKIVGPGFHNKDKIIKMFNNIQNVKMHFLGSRTQDEVIQLLHTNDILCIPSRSESLGIANIEGLATGISVVTTNVGGIPEVTNHGSHAWTCKPLNPLELSLTIKSCIESIPEKRFEMAKAGRKWVEEYFNGNYLKQNFQKMLNSNQ